MSAGQASAEYAGLLGLAAVIGAGLALVAGPPLAGAVRGALLSALSRGTSVSSPVVATAADIADVQSALFAGDSALTPDAALVALGRRHTPAEAETVARQVLLSTAIATFPELGASHRYRAWQGRYVGPYEPLTDERGDRDAEQPTGPPVAAWVTVGEEQQLVEVALTPHLNLFSSALDIISVIPEAGLARIALKTGAGALERAALRGVPGAVDGTRKALEAVDVVEADSGDVPAGMRAGDVVVAWRAHRTAWRDGRIDLAPWRLEPHGGAVRLALDYVHLVYLRPGPSGLAVIAEGIGT